MKPACKASFLKATYVCPLSHLVARQGSQMKLATRNQNGGQGRQHWQPGKQRVVAENGSPRAGEAVTALLDKMG